MNHLLLDILKDAILYRFFKNTYNNILFKCFLFCTILCGLDIMQTGAFYIDMIYVKNYIVMSSCCLILYALYDFLLVKS